MKLRSSFFSSIAVLVGTIIGAGLFGIPYAISKVGFFVGFLYLVSLGLVVLMVSLAFGEVVLRTKRSLQITGYAEKYLGKWGKGVLTFSFIFGVYGALLAYVIGVGSFLYDLLSPYFGGSAFIYSLIFYVLASLAVLAGLGIVKRIECFMVFFVLFVVGLLFIFGLSEMDLFNLKGLNLVYLFLPYGVILFAFQGMSAIPEMLRILKGDKKKLKRAIIISILISFIVYFLFALMTVSITGQGTSEEAIAGLGKILGRKVVIFGTILGILTMATSFLTLGLSLKNVFKLDYKIKNLWAWVLACVVPLIIFILGVRSFIRVIDVVGTVIGGLEGIIIILMFMKAKEIGDLRPAYSLRVPRFVLYLLMVVFGGGIVYQIVYSLLR